LVQVAEAVQQRAGRSALSRNAAYDLAKLKGKKLVQCVKGSRRYKADPSGVRAICAYLILRPFGRPPKLREELNRTFETIGLAPA
jgi:hypothetical protein